jgi:methionyl-tRNA formyltransferase
MKKTKYKVTFLFDKRNLWFEKHFKKANFKLSHKYTFKISKNPSKINNQDIVFPLSYTKVLPKSFLKKNKLVIIVHPSKLPKDKGHAPIQHQILRNKKKIYISLIKAKNEADSGPIYLQDSFVLNGTELFNEVRNLQAINFLKIIKIFLIKYPDIKFKKQLGKGSFNTKRGSEHSELDINKTIKQQFNHLRINDNEIYPSFFNYKGKKYIIKIYKEIKRTK